MKKKTKSVGRPKAISKRVGEVAYLPPHLVAYVGRVQEEQHFNSRSATLQFIVQEHYERNQRKEHYATKTPSGHASGLASTDS